MYPRERIKSQDDQTEPSHQLPANPSVDRIEQKEKDGEGHEVIPEQILLEEARRKLRDVAMSEISGTGSSTDLPSLRIAE